jgi:PTH1 family peptidyl-tRNA hydrolase
MQHLKTESFKRIRIGIGARPSEWVLADWVLSKFSKEELKTLKTSFMKILPFVVDWIDDLNFDKLMSNYNRL